MKSLLKSTAKVMFMFVVLISIQKNIVQAQAKSKDTKILVPELDGEWWSITGNPDLGYLTSPTQQPVDFGVWKAKDDTWQLWSCIRGTKEPGKSRLLYGWEGKSITDMNWVPQGIKMRSEPLVGEIPGGLQAPYVFRESDDWFMFYGDWSAICRANSKDGKLFERIVQENIEKVTSMFSEGAGSNTRDAMIIKLDDTYYCYYTAGFGYRNDKEGRNIGAVYCRTSKDKLNWSNSVVVSRGGRSGSGWADHECPFVVKIGENFYLFRTQKYGANNVTSVYCSTDPLNFGVDTDEKFFVTTLPVAAPELIFENGQWYIVALNPELNGVRAALLKWRSK